MSAHFSSVVIDFLLYLVEERHLSEHTVKAYKNDLTELLEFLCGETAGKADQALLDADAGKLSEFVTHLNSHEYQPDSIARKIACLRSFYKWLAVTRAILTNPALRLKVMRVQKKPIAIATTEQIADLLEMPDTENVLGVRDLAILEIILSSGLRTSEIIELNIGSMNSEGDFIVLHISGTTARARVIQLGVRAHSALKKYLEFRMTFDSEGTSPLFANKHGGRLSGRSVRRKLDKYLEMAGIDADINTFTLRHTYAQHLAGEGASKKEMQETLGFRSSSTAEQAYFPKTTPTVP